MRFFKKRKSIQTSPQSAIAAFTLLEVVLSLTILSILGGIGMTSLMRYRNIQQLDSTTFEIANIFRRAQSAARTQENNSAWGVNFDNKTTSTDEFGLYYGQSATSASYIIFSSLGSGFEFDAPTAGNNIDFNFAQVNGLPNATGSITIRFKNNTVPTRTITVNRLGEISY